MSTGDRCSVTGLAGTVDLHVSTVSPAQQSHLEAHDDPGGRGDTHSPLVAITTVVSTLATTVCGPPSILPVPSRLAVTTEVPYVSSGKLYHLHAWRLSCSTAKQQDFQRSLGSP